MDDELKRRVRQNTTLIITVIDKIRTTNDLSLAVGFLRLAADEQIAIQKWMVESDKAGETEIADILTMMLRAKQEE